MSNEKSFPQIKEELISKINKIDAYVDKMSIRIYGDPEATPPIPGLEERLKILENVEKERLKAKNTVIATAVGSLTLAIGAAVIWLGKLVFSSLGKGG